MSRKNSTIDYWQQHYQTFKAIKITQREYCRQNNLGYWTFNKWKRVFDQESISTSLQQLPVSYHPAKSEKFEIFFQDNVKISVPDNISEEALKKIMSALRHDS